MRMRIVQSFGPVGAGRRREIGKAADGGGFANSINAGRTARPTGAATLAPLATLGAMLAVQAAEDPLVGRRRARERGDRMLDVLEDLRSAMLDGRLSRGQLVGLQKLVAERQLSAGHARALLGTPDRAFQEALARRVVAEELKPIIAWPNRQGNEKAIVRHSRGHDGHIHVRFRCGLDEPRCRPRRRRPQPPAELVASPSAATG